MNCLKPDHPCYLYTCPPFLRIEGFENTSHDPPFTQPLFLAAFIPFSLTFSGMLLLHPAISKKWLLLFMKGGGRRFDAIWYKGLG